MEAEQYIDGNELANRALFAIQGKDEIYNALFNSLDSVTEVFSDRTVKLQEKYEAAISSEYIIARLRILVSDEQKKINTILASDASTSLITLFKKRQVVITSLLNRLNEITNDMSIIQKLMYTYNSKF